MKQSPNVPSVEYFREQAARCRRLAASITDYAAITALNQLAVEFELQAETCEEGSSPKTFFGPRRSPPHEE
jgi:hypothetical protein